MCAGGINITIEGLNLVPAVNFGSTSCPIVIATSRLVVCSLPRGEGRVEVTVLSSPVSSSVPFSYDPPVISRLLDGPAFGYAPAGGQAVTIIGQNFGAVLGPVR